VRRIGELTAAVLHAGRETLTGYDLDPVWRTPDATASPDGSCVLGVNSLVVRDRERVVVIDPCVWDPTLTQVPGLAVDLVPGPDLTASLAALGIVPADVSDVVVTHGHSDHCNGLLDDAGALRFPDARVCFPRLDWDAFVQHDAGHEPGAVRALLTPVADAGLLDLYTGDYAATPWLTLLHAPGETPGHSVVRCESGGQRLYHLGDLMHLPAEFTHLDWVISGGRDIIALEAARRRVLADAAGCDATFVFTHATFPAGGVVEDTAAAPVWRYL
jgi:glyoxylase-like metal-dependent hydrolase (beta-lactamase superfamily II)